MTASHAGVDKCEEVTWKWYMQSLKAVQHGFHRTNTAMMLLDSLKCNAIFTVSKLQLVSPEHSEYTVASILSYIIWPVSDQKCIMRKAAEY